MPKVQIPEDAVTTGDDVLKPVKNLLEGLNLKGSDVDTRNAGNPSAVFGGPPQSVALIEAGATAVSKWWATGLGAAVAATWTTVFEWWGTQDPAVKQAALWGAAIITAAAVLGIAYLLGSDVRGRSNASVATIQGRVQVANAFVQAAQAAFRPSPPAPSAEIVALPTPLDVVNGQSGPGEESGWRAVALSSNADDLTRYLLVKGGQHEWVDAAKVRLIPVEHIQLEVRGVTDGLPGREA